MGYDSFLPLPSSHHSWVPPAPRPQPTISSPLSWPHSRLTLMDTVFLVRMRLITSSWVQEEMEYPLIRTISSPTLATGRENMHQAAGQCTASALSPATHPPSAGGCPGQAALPRRQKFPHFTDGGTKMEVMEVSRTESRKQNWG